jgi:hypothetical protein
MGRTELTGEGMSGVERAPEADADPRPGGGEGNGDRLPDPGAGAGDDGAQTGEWGLSGLRGLRLPAGRRYPSAPLANG